MAAKEEEQRLCEQSEVHESLHTWLLQKCSERVPTDRVILKAQAVKFNRLLSRNETFKVSDERLWRQKVQHEIHQIT